MGTVCATRPVHADGWLAYRNGPHAQQRVSPLRPDGELGLNRCVSRRAEPTPASPNDGGATARRDHHPRDTLVGTVPSEVGASRSAVAHPAECDPPELRRQHDGRARVAVDGIDVACGVVCERVGAVRVSQAESCGRAPCPGTARWCAFRALELQVTAMPRQRTTSARPLRPRAPRARGTISSTASSDQGTFGRAAASGR
jgi:hypothetical protein